MGPGGDILPGPNCLSLSPQAQGFLEMEEDTMQNSEGIKESVLMIALVILSLVLASFLLSCKLGGWT